MSTLSTLSAVNALMVGDSAHTQEMLSAMTAGFGLGGRTKARSAEDSIDHMRIRHFDLVIVDYTSQDCDGAAIVERMRKEFSGEKGQVPILAIAGHCSTSIFNRYRDAGSSFVLCKPVTPNTLLQRILWLAKDTRPFISCDTYRGPDRRVRALGLPPGVSEGRRSTDLTTAVSDVAGANLDQSKIDGMFKPKRVVIT